MRNFKGKLGIIGIAAAVAALALALVGCGGGGAASSSSSTSAASASSAASSSAASSSAAPAYKTEATGTYASGTHTAVVTVKGFDPFEIALDADAAPVTVSNFCELAEDGFYDGTYMHRIVEGFCLQGGDPTATGTGGSDEEILGEFSTNNVANPLADDFQKGTVAMARAQDPNSASSQFFITLDSSDSVSASLNGQYAAFGTVSKSDMKTVDKIVKKYAKYADASMGTIASTDDMPQIESIKIAD